jgi:hypothetical protein
MTMPPSSEQLHESHSIQVGGDVGYPSPHLFRPRRSLSHEAPAGSPGPVVLPLEAPTKGRSRECRSIAPELAQEILDNPSDYYVNVHNPEHPGGAVRGQLA